LAPLGDFIPPFGYYNFDFPAMSTIFFHGADRIGVIGRLLSLFLFAWKSVKIF
jgi:hypothetical protein